MRLFCVPAASSSSARDSRGYGEPQSRVSGQAAALLPSPDDQALAAVEDGGVSLMGRAHWAAGWLHHLTGQPPSPAPADLLRDTAGLLAGRLGEWLRDDLPAAATTAQLTAAITGQVRLCGWPRPPNLDHDLARGGRRPGCRQASALPQGG
jgi:hypothetical protein